MNTANKLELHYYFNDDSHHMNAQIRNKCEAELLALIQEVAFLIGIEVEIDTEALKEGGVRNLWNLLEKNGVQIGIILSILIPVLTHYWDSDSEKDSLSKELLKVSIEEKKLNIQKLKAEANSGAVSDTTANAVAGQIQKDYKILTRKSNFYKNLDSCQKITGIGLNSLNLKNEKLAEEAYVPKSVFYKFIINSNQLPHETIDDAEIEIVAPVLKEGNYKWKGIYGDQSITFTMTDKDFKDDVLAKRVSFQHGAIINCVLKIGKELDETGEVVTNGYNVITVLSKKDGDIEEETNQGRRYKFAKNQKDNQEELFK